MTDVFLLKTVVNNETYAGTINTGKLQHFNLDDLDPSPPKEKITSINMKRFPFERVADVSGFKSFLELFSDAFKQGYKLELFIQYDEHFKSFGLHVITRPNGEVVTNVDKIYSNGGVYFQQHKMSKQESQYFSRIENSTVEPVTVK